MRQATTIKRTAVKSTTPKNRLETPLSETGYSNGNFYKKVQETAYQLYVARGYAHGYDVEDWIQAEQIVKNA
jgi:hypothetical protein